MIRLSEYLDRLGLFGIKLNLEQTGELLALAGHPERKLRFIHIAGSNGKGSCGAMLERALRECGFRTGFYSSPHLLFLGERFRIDGRAVSEAGLEEQAAGLIAAAEEMRASGRCPTYFEFTTVLAARLFASAGVDFVIWETGMGGRLDSTNAVTPELALITNISLEHTQYLGDTLAAIAGEKAGIIKPGKPVFCGEMPPEALAVIEKTAAERGCRLHKPEKVELESYEEIGGRRCQKFRYHGYEVALALPGEMQRRNFACAAAVIEYLAERFGFDAGKAFAALRRVSWPGRCQSLNARLIVDGGHNPDGVRSLAKVLAELYPDEKFCVVFGSFADKDSRSVLAEAAGFAAEFIFTPLRTSGRPSRSGGELAAMLREVAPEVPSRTSGDAAAALELARNTPYRTVAAGSLYLVGEVIEITGQTAVLEQL